MKSGKERACAPAPFGDVCAARTALGGGFCDIAIVDFKLDG